MHYILVAIIDTEARCLLITVHGLRDGRQMVCLSVHGLRDGMETNAVVIMTSTVHQPRPPFKQMRSLTHGTKKSDRERAFEFFDEFNSNLRIFKKARGYVQRGFVLYPHTI